MVVWTVAMLVAMAGMVMAAASHIVVDTGHVGFTKKLPELLSPLHLSCFHQDYHRISICYIFNAEKAHVRLQEKHSSDLTWHLFDQNHLDYFQIYILTRYFHSDIAFYPYFLINSGLRKKA